MNVGVADQRGFGGCRDTIFHSLSRKIENCAWNGCTNALKFRRNKTALIMDWRALGYGAPGEIFGSNFSFSEFQYVRFFVDVGSVSDFSVLVAP